MGAVELVYHEVHRSRLLLKEWIVKVGQLITEGQCQLELVSSSLNLHWIWKVDPPSIENAVKLVQPHCVLNINVFYGLSRLK